jgi:hypothetical protein
MMRGRERERKRMNNNFSRLQREKRERGKVNCRQVVVMMLIAIFNDSVINMYVFVRLLTFKIRIQNLFISGLGLKIRVIETMTLIVNLPLFHYTHSRKTRTSFLSFMEIIMIENCAREEGTAWEAEEPQESLGSLQHPRVYRILLWLYDFINMRVSTIQFYKPFCWAIIALTSHSIDIIAKFFRSIIEYDCE